MTLEEQQKQVAYIRSILGIRYKLNSTDAKRGLDCLTCTRKIQWELFGRKMPEMQIEGESPVALIKAVIKGRKLLDWATSEIPVHSCIVELTRGNTPHHIGTYFHLPALNIKGLVHCLNGAGVVYDPWNTLSAAGWRGFRYDVPRNT